MRHEPVLLKETVESLHLKPGRHVIDATLGDGGHAEAILSATAPDGKLLGIDADPESILRAKQYLYVHGDRVTCVRENFSHLSDIIQAQSFGPAHGILLDLGWSSPQFEERGRGFSFQKDEPLDMRLGGDLQATLTAAQVLSAKSEAEIETMLRVYGEEKFSREIAAEIAKARRNALIERTGQLIEIILAVYRKKLGSPKNIPWIGGLHPATRTFQALRIAVNDELGALESVLPQAIAALAPRGRLTVITFHSLEDRIVKHFFKSQEGKTLEIITKKPIVASEAEVEKNPRARSAKLRVVKKI